MHLVLHWYWHCHCVSISVVLVVHWCCAHLALCWHWNCVLLVLCWNCVVIGVGIGAAIVVAFHRCCDDEALHHQTQHYYELVLCANVTNVSH